MQGIQVTAVYFDVTTTGGPGPKLPGWREAVDQAREKIQRTEYRGQVVRPDSPDFHPRRHFQEFDVLVVYSRAFVEMRVTEPIQDRPGQQIPTGRDGPAMRWEVFRDGTVEQLPEEREREPEPIRGEDVTDGAGPDDMCGCGDPITMYDGAWLHIFNPELRDTDDHDAHPG